MEKIHCHLLFLKVSISELASKDLQSVELSFQAVKSFMLFSGKAWAIYMLDLRVFFLLTNNVSVIF